MWLHQRGGGTKLGVEFAGCSQIIDPWGDIVQKLDQEVGELKATLDLEKVPQIRKGVPIFASRVPEKYRKLYSGSNSRNTSL